MVTLSAVLQAPVQAFIRPSVWLPCYNRLHSYTERWSVEVDEAKFIAAVLTAVKAVVAQTDNTESLDIHKIDEKNGFIRLFAFTRAEWLDVIEIQRVQTGVYEVRSFSSGLCPLIVPFACILNLTLFWVPFYDNGFNKTRIDRLRSALRVHVTTQDNFIPYETGAQTYYQER